MTPRDRVPCRRAGNPLAACRAPLPDPAPRRSPTPAPAGQPAHGTAIVLAVHGWTARDEEAVLRIVRDVGCADIVVVNNDVLTHAESAAWCEGVVAHVAIVDPSFSAACNAGAAHAMAWQPERLLFTQADVTFGLDALVEAIVIAESYRDGDRMPAIGPSGGYIDGWPSPGPLVIVEHGRNIDASKVDVVAVDFIAGYWLLVPALAFVQAGAWDPGFTLYFEDVDISVRLAMTGCRPIVAPGLAVEHERSGTIAAAHGHQSRWFIQQASRDRFVAKWERLCVEPVINDGSETDPSR